ENNLAVYFLVVTKVYRRSAETQLLIAEALIVHETDFAPRTLHEIHARAHRVVVYNLRPGTTIIAISGDGRRGIQREGLFAQVDGSRDRGKRFQGDPQPVGKRQGYAHLQFVHGVLVDVLVGVGIPANSPAVKPRAEVHKVRQVFELGKNVSLP